MFRSADGGVNENLQAIVTVRFYGGARLECLLDAGFQGALVVVSRAFAETNSSLITERETFVEAENVGIEFDTAVAVVQRLSATNFSCPFRSAKRPKHCSA